MPSPPTQRVPGFSPVNLSDSEAPATSASPSSPPAPPVDQAAPPAPRTVITGSPVTPSVWRQAVEAIRKSSPRHGMSLAHGRVMTFQDGALTLGFAAEAAFHRSTVSGNGKVLIEKTLSELFARPIRLLVTDAPAGIVTDASPSMSLAEEEANARATREKSAEQLLRGHPAVRSVLQILGGSIEHIQVLDKETRPASEAVEPSAEDGA